MANAFQGFLQGFATGGAQIIRDQDQKDAALALFTAEREKQAEIDAKNKATAAQTIMDSQKQAVLGPQKDTTPTNSVPSTSIPSAATTPVDPQATTPQAQPNSLPASSQGITPTPTIQNDPYSNITATDRAKALGSLIDKHGPNVQVTHEQLNALVLARQEAATAKATKSSTPRSSSGNFSVTGEASATAVDSDKQDLALKFGVPVADPRIDPRRGMKQTQAGVYENKLQDRLAKLAATLPELDHNLDVSRQFQQMNEKATTGGAANVLSAIRENFSPEIQTLMSQNKQLTFANKPAGLSRITNAEFMVLRQAAQNTNNTKEANKNIANGLQAYLTREKEYIKFKSAYVAVNGHDQGADQDFDAYLEANPIFAPDASPQNNFALNPNRQTPKEFFHGTKSDGSPVKNTDPLDNKITAAKQKLNQGQADAASKLNF